MQSILAGQGNRSPGGKSVRQERALGKIVKPAVKLESTPPRASLLSPSLRLSLLFLVPRSVEASKKRPRFCVHAVMVMRGLRCVLAGCVSGPRNGNETVSHHHHQHPDDETRCERSTTVAGSEPRPQRCRPRSAPAIFNLFSRPLSEYRERE